MISFRCFVLLRVFCAGKKERERHNLLSLDLSLCLSQERTLGKGTGGSGSSGGSVGSSGGSDGV